MVAAGIPELRVVLSGFSIKGYFDMRPLVVKAFATILAVGSGLSLGKEGPLVHISCCIAAAYCRLSSRCDGNAINPCECWLIDVIDDYEMCAIMNRLQVMID